MLEGATRITNLDRENMLCPIDLDRFRKYNTKKKEKKKKKKKLARLKIRKGGLGKS